MNNLNTFSDFIAEQIIIDRASENLSSWFNTLGLEGTQQLIEGYRDKSYAQIYVKLMQERGLMK